MLVAKNVQGKLINIKESNEGEIYTCPICKQELIRNFGIIKQFFSHHKDKDGNVNDCELKLKLILKENKGEFNEDEMDILREQYYEKEFNDVKVEMSDYISEEGYYLTKEQKDIIFSKEDRIKVSALAGSAKSSTLYYYAKERPYSKILYIVYNKAMKLEGERMFSKLNNTQILTIHGLAYRYVGAYYKHKLTFNYSAVDVIKDLKLDWKYDQELAVRVKDMLTEYMLSDVENINDLDMYKDLSFKGNRTQIVSLSEKLWEMKKDYNSPVKVEHDFYLKEFCLKKCDLSNKYDIILIDEAQDASMLILDMINNSKIDKQIFVGDNLQSIYQWRKSVNILDKVENAKEYKLTTSFRVGQGIANISNLLVKDIYDIDINMKGFNTNQKIVDKLDYNEQYTILCRTNGFIFAESIEAVRKGKKRLYYEGGYSGYKFENCLDCYYFYKGHKVKNSLFNKFENYRQMEDYAKHNEDIELLSLIRLVEKYGAEIPSIINSIKDNTVNDKDSADILLSTIHKSKGQTYKNVLLSDDHFDINNIFEKKFIYDSINSDGKTIKDYYEELNILYVAITRTSKNIELSDTLKSYLITRYKYFKEYKEDDKNK